MIHLDTSFLVRAMDLGSPEDHQLRRWVGAGENLVMSTVAWTEFLCGPLEETEVEFANQVIGRIIDFNQDHAIIAARLFNESGRRRGALIDCMIAAVALDDGASIATANVSDFRRFEASGLQIV